MKNDCPFCMEVLDRTLNPLGQSRVVFETEHFLVFPTVGCLVVNYLLVVPKKHYICFGHLKDEECNELNTLLDSMQQRNNVLLKSTTIMFEHGSTEENSNAGNSVYHAHLHVLPFSKTLKTNFSKDCIELAEIDSIRELKKIMEKRSSYLYYHDIDGKNYIIIHAGIESQYFRRLISRSLGIPDNWNWREYPYFENMHKTLSLHHGSALCL